MSESTRSPHFGRIHVLGGTQLWSTSPEISEQEKTFRWLARESRTRRRMLSKALGSLIADTPAAGLRQMRTVKPSRPGDPYYVFLLLPRLPEVAETEYREVRGKLLGAYCQVAKFVFPDAQHIIGIATEPGNVKNRSEDIVHLDATEWTAEMNEEARRLQRDLGLFTDLKVSVGKEKEYPINHENAEWHTQLSFAQRDLLLRQWQTL